MLATTAGGTGQDWSGAVGTLAARARGPPSWSVMSAGAELAAVSSSLDELTRRVGRILAELSPPEQDRYQAGLLEVERTLGVASRRLERLVGRP